MPELVFYHSACCSRTCPRQAEGAVYQCVKNQMVCSSCFLMPDGKKIDICISNSSVPFALNTMKYLIIQTDIIPVKNHEL